MPVSGGPGSREKNCASIASISSANHRGALKRTGATRYRSLGGAVYNLARWLTHHKQDAEDVVQESYLRAFRFFPGFRGGDARFWLMKIVRNTCFTWLHLNRPLQDATEFDENLFSPDSRAPNPEEVVLQNDSRTLMRKVLEKLPLNSS